MKKGSFYLWLLCLVLLQSCNKNKPAGEKLGFKKPFIKYSANPAFAKKPKQEALFVVPSHPLFAGKYSFSDSIVLVPGEISTHFEKDLLIEPGPNLPDSLDYNGFELVADYENEIYFNRFRRDSTLYCHYPVYLVNTTNAPKLFLGKDSHGFGIQEAIDTTRQNWVPIESKLLDFCGNGEWGLIVRPNEFIVLLLTKYSGKTKTKMRVRIANGPSVYVSKPFKGNISHAQFSLNERMKDSFKDPESLNPTSLFYGAILPEDWLH